MVSEPATHRIEAELSHLVICQIDGDGSPRGRERPVGNYGNNIDLFLHQLGPTNAWSARDLSNWVPQEAVYQTNSQIYRISFDLFRQLGSPRKLDISTTYRASE